ncbi:MAG: hypothetical protein M1820_003007 [Bogoriella megaspora]|nr:MAG: hypothetical protein M1820_003007 [Bogoriella megaspora]
MTSPSFLPILPVLTSTTTFTLSLIQFPIFTSFLANPPASSISGRPLSIFTSRFILPGTIPIIASCLTSVISGFYTYRALPNLDLLRTPLQTPLENKHQNIDIAAWYFYGALSALGHFAFVPFVAPRIRRVRDFVERKGKDAKEDEIRTVNEREVRGWLVVHAVRTAMVDLVAVVCFVRGLLGILKRA